MLDINVTSIKPATDDLLWMGLRLERLGINNGHGSKYLFSVRVIESI